MCQSKDLGAAENAFSPQFWNFEETNMALGGFLLGRWESMLSPFDVLDVFLVSKVAFQDTLGLSNSFPRALLSFCSVLYSTQKDSDSFCDKMI